MSDTTNLQELGPQMYEMITGMFPICRSITGDGLRDTLRAVQRHIPLEIHEVPSGTQVFDWVVPREWNVRDAYVANAQGERVIDFRKHNLHLVNYSIPVRARMSLAELRPRLFTLPDQPDLIPYRTSYYNETWGFCLSHNDLQKLEEGEYEVVVDTTLAPGHLSYGEFFLPGETDEVVMFTTHCCHPSICNDNLSGIAHNTFLAKQLMAMPKRRYSYRFLFGPGTIGAITWLALNEAKTKNIRHGLVIANMGDGGFMHYKQSRRGNAEIDRIVEHVLRTGGGQYDIRPFIPWGYDERQYCSPGFNLPMGSLSRTPNGQYPEYHTSADNLSFVYPEKLVDSLSKTLKIVEVIEHDRRYMNTNPKCEPQLGKRGLYSAVGGRTKIKETEHAMFYLLNFSDGEHSLLDIAERANLPFSLMKEVAELVMPSGLIVEAGA